MASAPNDITENYRVGVMYTIRFNEATNRGNLPTPNISKSQVDDLFGFSSSAFPLAHPIGQNYSGSWSTDNTSIKITILSVNYTQLSIFGPPQPAGLGAFFRVSVKEAGDLRNSVNQCSPTVINDNDRALRMYGGPNVIGLDCDCCSQCGTCSVCSETTCASVTGDNGILVDTCTSCCTGPNMCCRILQGNYGIVVAITTVLPKAVPSLGAKLTLSGKGFDLQPLQNRVLVGGIQCPILGLEVNADTRLGNLTCFCPAGIGPDLKAVQVCGFGKEFLVSFNSLLHFINFVLCSFLFLMMFQVNLSVHNVAPPL